MDSSSLNIKNNYDLQPHNTLAVPSRARWFAKLYHTHQIAETIEFMHQQSTAITLLGGGSNVVLPQTLDSLVLQVMIAGREIVTETDADVVLKIAAGENWHDTVMWCIEQGYYGLENLALIPGSVGAAPIQNIGAYGVELSRCLQFVDVVDLQTGQPSVLSNEDCELGYRSSVFKTRLRDRYLITHVTLRLNKQFTPQIHYPALKSALEKRGYEQPTAVQIAETVMAIRRSKLPAPEKLPNAGSFFKNPMVDAPAYHSLKQRYPDLVAYSNDDGSYKLAAGWLLDRAGWKGKILNGVAMHQQQALVLTNPERVDSEQLLAFVGQVQESILSRFEVMLEVEPRIY